MHPDWISPVPEEKAHRNDIMPPVDAEGVKFFSEKKSIIIFSKPVKLTTIMKGIYKYLTAIMDDGREFQGGKT